MSLWKISAVSVVTLTVLTANAHAADPAMPLPLSPAPMAIVDVDNWTGFYAGVNAGYGFGETYDGAGALPLGAASFDGVNGLLGGAQIGGNIQQDTFVFGLEADIQASGMTQTIVDGAANDVITGIDYFGTVRGRVGVDMDGILPFLTGGLAYGQGYVDDTDAGNTRDTLTHFGWTAGGGVEFKMDDQFSVKGEYLYTDLGTQSYPVPGFGGPTDIGHRFHTVRIGANFHF